MDQDLGGMDTALSKTVLRGLAGSRLELKTHPPHKTVLATKTAKRHKNQLANIQVRVLRFSRLLVPFCGHSGISFSICDHNSRIRDDSRHSRAALFC